MAQFISIFNNLSTGKLSDQKKKSPDRYPFFRAQVEEARQYHSDMKILAYLRTSLKGSAFESVRAVLLSGSSLDDILTVLRKHFGNPKVIVRNVTDRLSADESRIMNLLN